MRRIVLIVAVVLAALPVPAAVADGGAEAAFVARINAERTARGLPPLQVYWDLVDDARRHSAAMGDAGEMFHNPGLGSVTSGWEALGENVGVGPGVDALQAAFMASPSHAANITGDYNYVGVGVVVDGADRMWVTVVFMRGPADLLDPEPAQDPPREEAQPEPDGQISGSSPAPRSVAAVRAAGPVSRPRAHGWSRWRPLAV
ncbi:MAG: CAP domain-containing protein [Acidimicrobiia bacterium]